MCHFHCLLTSSFRALFNASVAVYNPYTDTVVESITFPNLSGDPILHLGPALPDQSGGLTVLLDAAAAFNTNGKDISGPNIVLKYDLAKKAVVWQRNLTEITQGQYGGYQDVEHDKNGNIYVIGSFPGTIMRVDQNGEGLSPWFLPPAAQLANSTVSGFSGAASIRAEDVMIVNNNADGQIYRFDNVSSSPTGRPVLIPRTAPNGSAAAPMGFGDAILLPAKYRNTVLLVAGDAAGVTVVRSRDGKWRSAETLGTISNNASAAMGGQVPVAIEIGGDKLFAVEEYFTDAPLVAGTNAGNRSAFPLVDITAQVDALLGKRP